MNISFLKIESLLGNFCFLISLLTTIYYWIKIIFVSEKNSFRVGFIGFFILNILLSIELINRWIESGHFPLSNLYESLLFLSWGITSIYLILEKFSQTEFIGILISPLVLCILAFSDFSLPVDLQGSKPLVPALQSNWLFMHVSVMILSYAGLLIGSILAITYLVVSRYPVPQSINESPPNSETLESGEKVFTREKFLLFFDDLSYRIIGIGFCFLTLGILSGAVWANETWGTYWSWDPKETWALITWLTFAIYLHTRLVYGWQGNKSAFIASFGFILVWICYLGVNLLGKGLHSYGFLT
jgi:cytochrome c-type biogenesis protein CcsB